MKPWQVFITALLLGNTVKADITDEFRRANAVVLYEFKDTDDTLRDTADPKFGAPLNLRRYRGTINRNGSYWEFTNASQVRSTAAAKKIYDNCRPKNEMSVEILLSGNESVQKRTGEDADGVVQPLRIVSYSNSLTKRNFTIGQFYDGNDGGNKYAATVTNRENQNNSLTEPLTSSVDAISVASAQGAGGMQKLIFTFKNGVARMYLTDKDNHLYLHRSTANGFRGNLDPWDQNAYFMIGNEYVGEDRFYSYNDQYETCDNERDSTCGVNPNRYWKGRIHLVAVYCKELTREEIFGAQLLQQVTNPTFPIDTSIQITPELKRAQEIYLRLTGVKTPIFNPVLGQMVQKLSGNDPIGAAELATQDPNFYNITVRDFAAKMSNRDETINVPLNDFTATVIGAVRDQINAQRLLYDNIVYIGDKTKAAVPSNLENDIIKSNNHYETLGNERFDLAKVLVASTQHIFDGQKVVPNPTPAGLLTTRQWISSHAVAGTNRRPVEFAFREFLCTPIELVADSTGPDNVVGPDIDRFPGGSHSKYASTCRACHTILDGFRPAFAHFTFSNGIVKHGFVSPMARNDAEEDAGFGMQQNPVYIAKKLNHNNDVYKEGRITTDDAWTNNAIFGANATTFQWSSTSGKGIRQFGQLLAGSKQFPRCMARRAFVSLCKREPAAVDQTMLNAAADEFASSRNYNLKWLFQKIVTTKECLGEVQ